MAAYRASDVEHGRAPVSITARTDNWWYEPALIITTLVAFSVYAVWRAWEGSYFNATQSLQHGVQWAPAYLSPFYSPPIHEWFPHLAIFRHISPAFFVLIFPLSFRATCYYCRRSYYRAFFWDPPACGMHEPFMRRRKGYTGESRFPFTLQNLHRYALYLILIVVVFHYLHLYDSFWMVNGAQTRRPGVGMGTVIFFVDTLMLTLYVFSCHAWRHFIGGGLNRMSNAPLRTRLWSWMTVLNARHGLYFWISLITVGLADFYVRLVASGAITDLRIV